jgi:hypothetical protein
MSFYLNAKVFFARLCLPKIASVMVLTVGLPACAAPVNEGTTQRWFQYVQSDVLPQDIQPVMLLRWAIIGQESGANFRAVNPHSGALGYAQVMPSNLPKWSKEALGYVVTRKEFLNRPDLQLAIVDYKLSQYWKKSLAASKGNEALAVMRVAAWWYSGKPEKFRSTRAEFYRGHRYPSIAAYSRSVLKRYRNLIGDSEDALLPRPPVSGRRT